MKENKEPRIVTILTDEQFQFLSANSSVINGESYFMPYWFKRIEGNKFELFPLGNLPADLSAEIAEMREQVKCDTICKPLITGEDFDQAVNRYLDHPKDETMEERAERIKRFRCGY